MRSKMGEKSITNGTPALRIRPPCTGVKIHKIGENGFLTLNALVWGGGEKGFFNAGTLFSRSCGFDPVLWGPK